MISTFACIIQIISTIFDVYLNCYCLLMNSVTTVTYETDGWTARQTDCNT